MENDKSAEIKEKLSIKYMKNEIIKKCSDVRSAEIKMNQFIECFENDIGKDFPSDCEKASFNVLTVVLFDGPLLLYAIGMNTSAIMELHSILERFSSREVSKVLAKPSHESVVKKMLERYTLPGLAKILRDLDILDDEDVNYAERLNRLRNGIAHRNERVISNALCSSRTISLLDIDHEVNKIDVKPYLLSGIVFLYKLFNRKSIGSNR